MEIGSIGFYNSEGTWFYFEPLNGFDGAPEPHEDTQMFAKVSINDIDSPAYKQLLIPISHEEALFLQQLYKKVSKDGTYYG